MNLNDIKSPQDIKSLSTEQLQEIAKQMREATIARCAAISGHVGPNLGDVESVIAMHYVFDAPVDKLVFDVSHQDFPHKMLTGRAYGFTDPKRYHEIGEYTDPKESPEYDIFYAGHTSPSISLCVGLAKARELKHDKYNIVAYIGDGALSGGEAFEGLDAGGALDSNFIVILNDNQMAIAEDHGGMYKHLQKLRETNGTAANNIFRAFGYDYIYVADGNNITDCIEAFRKVKDVSHPVVVHINTQKGEGYPLAEEFREEYHWKPPFNPETGEDLHLSDAVTPTTVLSDFLMESAANDPKVLVISSATPGTFDLTPEKRAKLGSQYIDVAIAEQTGVSVMAGAARGGAKPIYCVIASFLQRAYDQLLEDWAMDPSPATMVVCATGIAGIPDLTHLGFWDIPMVTSIPEIVYLAPTSIEEFKAMLEWSLGQDTYKVAIRQPIYNPVHADGPVDTDYSDINKFKMVAKGDTVAIIAAGDYFEKGKEVTSLLSKQGINATLINPRFISGVDNEMLDSLSADHKLVATLEDGSVEGGFGQRVASALGASGMKVLNFGLAKRFEDRYDIGKLEEKNGLTPAQIADKIMKTL